MTTCIIINYQQSCIEELQTIIEKQFGDTIKFIAKASTAKEGIEIVQNLKPNLVFIQIELPDESGFKLLERFHNHQFEVIFTSMSKDYALSSIKFNPAGYLVYPFILNDVKESIARAIRKLTEKEQYNIGLRQVIENLKKNNLTKIPLPVLNGLQMVNVEDIVFCKADEDFTQIYFSNESKNLIVSKGIKYFENLLYDYGFFRVHHSFVVNKNFIKMYRKGEGGQIVTDLGHEIPVSRRRKAQFLDWLKEI